MDIVTAKPPKSGEIVRREILDSLTAHGILYDLIDGVFRFCDEDAVLPLWESGFLEDCRSSFTEHLRRKRGLCLSCQGSPEPATRPRLQGYAGRRGTVEGMIRKSAPDWMIAKYPPLWCDACYESGRALKWAAGQIPRSS